MRAALALAALALAAVLVPVPGAAAAPAPTDVVQLDVANIHTLPPATPKLANVTVTYCAASSGLAAGARQVAVTLADGPEWLDISVEPETFTFALVLPGECDTARGVVRFNATPDAPAFETTEVTLAAVDAQNGTTYTETLYYFRVGYYGDLRVTPQTARVDAPQNEHVTHRVAVRNLGNADTTFRIHLAGSRHDAQVAIPRPLVLAPDAEGTWDVTLLVPGGTGLEPRDVELLVTSHARMDHEALGGSRVLRITLDPEHRPGSAGFNVPAPAFALTVAACGIAAVAFGGRRTR